MSTIKEILKSLRIEKRGIQAKKHPVKGYSIPQRLRLIEIGDMIREYKRVTGK